MASEIRVNSIHSRTGLGTVSLTDTGAVLSGVVTATTFSGPLTGNVTGSVTSTGPSSFDVITGVSTVGVAQTLYVNAKTASDQSFVSANNLDYPIIVRTGTYSSNVPKTLIGTVSDTANPTKLKTAIFTREHGSGSEIHFCTSSSYVTGITTSAYVDEVGRFHSNRATYAQAYADGTQSVNTINTLTKVTLATAGTDGITFDSGNNRLIILEPGAYHVTGRIQRSASSNPGAWTPNIYIFKNGSNWINNSYLHESYTGGHNQTIDVSRTGFLDAGDYIELYWQQNITTTITMTSNCALSIIRGI